MRASEIPANAPRRNDFGGKSGGKEIDVPKHMLSARQVQVAREGDTHDGEGLILRVQGRTASWVLRYRVASGKRRELGLGAVDRGSIEAAGASLTGARELADQARDQLKRGIDPIDARRCRAQSRVGRSDEEARRRSGRGDHAAQLRKGLSREARRAAENPQARAAVDQQHRAARARCAVGCDAGPYHRARPARWPGADPSQGARNRLQDLPAAGGHLRCSGDRWAASGQPRHADPRDCCHCDCVCNCCRPSAVRTDTGPNSCMRTVSGRGAWTTMGQHMQGGVS
jgi:hypothetical protein